MKYPIAFVILGVVSAADHSPLRQAPAKELARVNPYGGQPRAKQAGRKLFERECAACHGAKAEGTRFAPPLASSAVSKAPDGAIEWVLRNGSLRYGMPPFADLPRPQRWQIVTYLKGLDSSRRVPND